jgi:hypothetical protein
MIIGMPQFGLRMCFERRRTAFQVRRFQTQTENAPSE